MNSILRKTVGDIIEEALLSARIIASGHPIEAEEYDSGINSINNVCKYLQTKGTHLWLEERAILPLNAGQKSYTLGLSGAYCGYEDTFYNTTLTAAAVTSATTLTVASTSGMAAPASIFAIDPTLSTAEWVDLSNFSTSFGTAALSISSGLVITNGAAKAAGVYYAFNTEPGHEYKLTFTFTAGTSATFRANIYDIGFTEATVDTATFAETLLMSTTGEYSISCTAKSASAWFRFNNQSVTSGHYSTVSGLTLVDVTTGSKIGIQLDDGTRHWTTVDTVGSSTSVTITTGLASAAASGNTVYSYTQQIDKPLRVRNVTYADSLTSSEIPVEPWSRQEYMQQTDKSNSGTVVAAYYKPQIDDGILFTWQTANSVNNILRLDIIKPMALYTEISETLDVPEEYLQAIKWNIAADLGPSFGISDSRQAVLESKAMKAIEDALDNDAEDTSVFFAPDNGNA